MSAAKRGARRLPLDPELEKLLWYLGVPLVLAVEIDGFKEALIRGVAVENKKKLRHSKGEKEKNAAATLQDLTSLQGDVEALEK